VGHIDPLSTFVAAGLREKRIPDSKPGRRARPSLARRLEALYGREMAVGGCPKCGGRERHVLSPGYFECTSRVVTGGVPPSASPTATAIPVYGPCGFRYQEGRPSAVTQVCTCGMFAVGVCSTCRQPRCGEHGAHDQTGRFVCVAHIAEAKARADAAQREQGQRDVARADTEIAAYEAALEAALPGFPIQQATGPQLAAALEPRASRRKRVLVTRRKMLGRSEIIRGWVFGPVSGDPSIRWSLVKTARSSSYATRTLWREVS
jgi:hypothetical protein